MVAGKDQFSLLHKSMVLTSVVKDTTNEYEFVILNPHFLLDGRSLMVKHPTTECFTKFCSSEDGFLREGSRTGPLLPPLRSRFMANRNIPLNPILVNFAARARMRRFDCQSPGWRKDLHPGAQKILTAVDKLYAAVIWRPQQQTTDLDALRLMRASNFPLRLSDPTAF